jgi:hypothetical protein
VQCIGDTSTMVALWNPCNISCDCLVPLQMRGRCQVSASGAGSPGTVNWAGTISPTSANRLRIHELAWSIVGPALDLTISPGASAGMLMHSHSYGGMLQGDVWADSMLLYACCVCSTWRTLSPMVQSTRRCSSLHSLTSSCSIRCLGGVSRESGAAAPNSTAAGS